MHSKTKFWSVVILLLMLAGLGWWYVGKGSRVDHGPAVAAAAAGRTPVGRTVRKVGPVASSWTGSAHSRALAAERAAASAAAEPDQAAGTNGARVFAYRLSNTTKSLEELARSETAVMLKNALMDTGVPVGLKIPAHLRSAGDPGSYVVQARGLIDGEFRQRLEDAGAQIVSYIPNNAYLVRVSAAGAQLLRGFGQTQAVLPFEPYYKFVEERLLEQAVKQEPLAANTRLNVVLFPGEREAGLAGLRGLGAQVVGEERTPFGPMLVVEPRADTLAAVAGLASVQGIEVHRRRALANDLARLRAGVSTNTTGLSPGGSHLGLTGTNVLVNVNDTGVDTNHPDLNPRVFPLDPNIFGLANDPDGHGTHVAGIIASSGANDGNVRARGSLTNADFRGMAPGAGIFSQPIDLVFGAPSDVELQENAARTNYFGLGRTNANAPLISNNSWVYPGAFDYNFAAASYDAAVRDALPGVPGSQPLLFVFAAGNEGFGSGGGQGGQADSIESPGTGKNVITVGAIEQPRFITNEVTINGITTRLFLGLTDSSNQVAGFSSRGNVGVGIEGASGRFKPDLVAPGTFVVSTRSTQWDTNAYYNQLGDLEINRIELQRVDGGQTNFYLIYVPTNAIVLGIRVLPNNLSPSPFPALPVHLRLGAPPASGDFRGNNQAAINNPGSGTWQYSIGNPGVQPVAYDIQTMLVLTNDPGTLLNVLRGLNEDLVGSNGPAYYRYESGTSQATPVVSGVLALMQEFFEQRAGRTNSPALMKALLINGARSINALLYDLQVQSGINHQGWGLVNLTNVLPNANVAGWPIRMVDQSPTNVLGTGQSHTYQVGLEATATNVPLRVTLAWTDPPGNPVGSIKLVNDLDLIVTNLDNPGEVYYGNNIPVGSDFNDFTSSDTLFDVVNNVENVYVGRPLRGRNFSVTVHAHRVNVNAVTANTNDIVQDYALVVSSGNGTVQNSITTFSGPARTTDPGAFVFRLTNNAPLLNQRVAANSQFITTTNGQTNQWNFYVFEHTNSFTNLAFVTFLPPNLSRPRHVDADIDLYVSTASGLTNLTVGAVSGARKSRGRSGIEAVVYSNAVPGTYYVGIKSEDQQGASFGLFGIASEAPFSQRDALGNLIVLGIPVGGVDIPDGTPALPGGAVMLGLALEPITIRRVVVTNTITHENFGDLLGNLSHGDNFAVLNNHTFGYEGLPTTRFIYEDAGERDLGAFLPVDLVKHSDGPGSLEDFVGEEGVGVWMLTMVDNSPFHTGRVDTLSLRLEPQVLTNNPPGGTPLTIAAGGSFCDTIDVPADAISLTVYVVPEDPGTMVQVLVRRGGLPTINQFDKAATINYPGGALTLTTGDVPPLTAGRYFICVINPDPSSAVKVRISIQVERVPHAVLGQLFLSAGSVPLLDDAVTNSSIQVPYNLEVASVQVGVRINHPRVSDLVLSLVSPQGTRILLAENRGGPFGTNYGSGNLTTNAVAADAGGGIAAATVVAGPVQPIGTILIQGDFGGSIPDTMHIYYDGVLIFDSGLTADANLMATVLYGPGSSTNITIIMNEGGNPNAGTQWSYTATILSGAYVYATFTENTNLTTTPIKFAPPPFTTNGNVLPNVIMRSDFDSVAPSNYGVGQLVDGWFVRTNEVSVLADAGLAHSGTNLLVLSSAQISRVLPTIIGRRYALSYAYRGQCIVGWWPGDTNATDIIGGNTGTNVNGLGFTAGMVNQAFSFPGVNQYVRVPASPRLNVGTANGFTIETWINPSDVSSQRPLVEWNDSLGSIGAHFWISVVGGVSGGPGALFANIVDAGGTSHQISSGPNIVSANTWQHVAVAYDKTTGFTLLYRNGVPVASTNLGGFTPQTSSDLFFGYRSSGPAAGAIYRGLMDEVTLYNCVLSPTEMQALYLAGSAGKCSSLTCLPNAQVVINGITNNLIGTNTWILATNSFGAISNGTTVQFSGHPLSMLFDSFQLLETDLNAYYLPEESLARLLGENALGDWRLEVWDNRVGATNQTALLSWQLDLTFAATNRPARRLVSGTPLSGTLSNNQMACFIVDVPPLAGFATNYLSSTGPVDLWFGTNGLPDGSNPGDFLLVSGVTSATILIATNGAFLLSPSNIIIATISTNGPPNLPPGQRYYLCLGNTNPTNQVNNYTIRVDFDNTAGALSAVRLNNSIVTHALLPRTPLPHYYQFTVSSNAAAVSFEVIGADENVTLDVSRGGLPTFNDFDYGSASGLSTDRQIIVTPGSLVALVPGDWYMAVYNNGTNGANYSIRVTEYEATSGAGLGKPLRLLPLTDIGPGVPAWIRLDAVMGQSYRVDYSGDLLNWFVLMNFTATNVIVTVPDTVPVGVEPRRFYRAVQNPGP